MSGQSGGHRLRLSKLNDQLTCKLCGGYFIDATTIIECLHSFCRSCIVKYLENNKYCPICEVQVHKSKPLLNIRPDRTLQDIVYKLVPGCYQNEMRCRREFYFKHPEACTQVTSPEARGEPTESHIYSPDESLSLSLEYYNPSKPVKEITIKPLLRRYLRCPAAVTIFHLQKLIRAKYGLTDAHRVDVMYKEEPLCSSYTLMDVMYIYHWRRKVPLHLSYRIFESSPKRIKLSEDNINYKTSLLHAGIDSIELKEEKPMKREWKEVQLKISETGIMSITDISDQQFKKNARAEEPIASIETINSSIIQETIGGNDTSQTPKKSEQSLDRQIIDNCDISSKLSELNEKKTSNETEGERTSIKETENTMKSKEQNELKDQSDNNNIEDKTVLQSDVQSRETTQIVHKEETRGNCNDKDQRVSLKNNSNTNTTENKVDTLKQNSKNEVKLVNTGSKINALSVKLQFQPKVGQIGSNSTSLKKTTKDKKILPQTSKKVDAKAVENSKATDSKNSSDTPKTQVTINNCGATASKSLVPVATKMSPKSVSESKENGESVLPTQTTATNSESDTKSNVKSTQSADQNRCTFQEENTTEKKTSSQDQTSTEITEKSNGQTNAISQKLPIVQVESLTNENLASFNVSLPAAVSNGINSTSMMTISQPASTFSCTVQDSMNSTMLKDSHRNLTMSVAQKLSTSTASENTVTTNAIPGNSTAFSMPLVSITSLKNSYTNPGISTSRESTLKASLEMTSAYSTPPCPDAIPISLMKPPFRKNELITKGSNLNEICAKIGASGSKINDICAKIGENSKEKNKTEARNKADIPDLLKIRRKNSSSSIAIDSTSKQQHTNIPNVPIYAPSSNAITTENKSVYSNVKDSLRATSLVSTSPIITSHAIQKIPSSVSKKQSQAVGYKTLRDPPRCWNPTLSKNNYVAVKNQSKETQSQLNQTVFSEKSKSIQSKPAKIFKMRNMPRYLGNPASGVKPMYGIGNESKEKEQLTLTTTTTTSTSTNSKNGSLSMMKIDPKTLSPIVSTVNSPIVSPPPYSPSARNYPNPPFSRDICRNTGSPISPKNSPVNMLSTSPFIPSPTPNVNPRLIYSHFPPPFPDATRFPNPLIRSPIGIPSPSAFHSSLPPSINKLYQRSSYIPQTTGFSPVSQPPTVQRIPQSTYSSPKSPKTTSLTAISPTSYGLTKSETQIVATTSLESSNLLLPENTQQEDLSAFNLSKAGIFCNSETVKTSTEMARTSKSVALPPTSNVGQSKGTSMATSKTKPEASQLETGHDQQKEKSEKESSNCEEESSYISKGQHLEKKRTEENSDNVNKKKEKSVTQVNGDLLRESNGETSTKKHTEQQKEQNETKTVQGSDKIIEKHQEESKNDECGKSEEQRKKSEPQASKPET